MFVVVNRPLLSSSVGTNDARFAVYGRNLQQQSAENKKLAEVHQLSLISEGPENPWFMDKKVGTS